MTFETSSAHKPLILALGAGLGGHVHHVKCYYMDLADVSAAPS